MWPTRQTTSDAQQKLSVVEKVGYGLGDTAANFIFQTMVMFQLAFYTDTFGITAAAAGTLLVVVRVWDAVFDPIDGRDRRPHEHALGQVPALGAVDGRALRDHGLPHVHDPRPERRRASSSTPT